MNCLTSGDLVPAIRCPVWPDEAAEWIARERPNGWPSKSLVTRCQKAGCHLVSAAHKFSPQNEFRISFSLAETLLLNNWEYTQTHIYIVLKRIKSLIEQRLVTEAGFSKDDLILKSYHLKTLMLWHCEDKKPEFWKIENVFKAASYLVLKLVGWLIERRCDNYFIRTNNMFDHIPDHNPIWEHTVNELGLIAKNVNEFFYDEDLAKIYRQNFTVVPDWILSGVIQNISHSFELFIAQELFDLYISLRHHLEYAADSKLANSKALKRIEKTFLQQLTSKPYYVAITDGLKDTSYMTVLTC